MNRNNSPSSHAPTVSYHSGNTARSEYGSSRDQKTSARIPAAPMYFLNPQPAQQNSAHNEEQKISNHSKKLKDQLNPNSSSNKVDTISERDNEEFYESLMTRMELDQKVQESLNFLTIFEQKMILEMLKNPDYGFKFKDEEKQKHAEQLIETIEFIMQGDNDDSGIYEKWSKQQAEQKLRHFTLLHFLEDLINRQEGKAQKPSDRKEIDLKKIKNRLKTKDMTNTNQVKYQIEFIEGYSIATQNKQFKKLKNEQEFQNPEEKKKYKKKHANLKKDIDKHKQRNK